MPGLVRSVSPVQELEGEGRRVGELGAHALQHLRVRDIRPNVQQARLLAKRALGLQADNTRVSAVADANHTMSMSQICRQDISAALANGEMLSQHNNGLAPLWPAQPNAGPQHWCPLHGD